jgi:glycerol-3-phosphate O-acyltransferase
MDNINLEFFIEGTRSRTNKIVYPKYGFISILTQAYYKKKVKELTFVPVTINYTRTLEGETFPYELTGEEKVKESLGRIVKAVQIFSMNLGSIYLDFCEPIVFSEFNKQQVAINPKLNPDVVEKDRLTLTNSLGLEIIYSLLRNIRIMPTNLVAAIILMQRKGINKDDLKANLSWLG